MSQQPPPSAGNASSAENLHRKARESAEQVWLAGLGALAKAQQEGGKVFEGLVREGMALQRKTQQTAQEHLAEASTRLGDLASDLGQRASGSLGRLEDIFEERVAKALERLGVPTTAQVRALHERIDALSREVEQLRGSQPGQSPRDN